MRICVIGAAGAVGSASAAELVGRMFVDELVLVDTDSARLAVLEMDLSLKSALAGSGTRVRAGEPAEAAKADLIVLAASVRHRDGVERMAFFAQNVALLDAVLSELPRRWSGVLVIATNPVDPLCTFAARRLGPAATVLGYCLNDSLKLAEGVAIATGRVNSGITSWVLGEHGPHMVPLRERVRIDGHKVDLSQEQWTVAVDHLRTWYQRWQRHRTGTTSMWATGAGIARLITAFVTSEPSILPVCVRLSGQYGVDGVCLGAPVVLGDGAYRIEEWLLTAQQRHEIRVAAQVVASAARGT